ncbi:MAG: efflux RND transporter periplasmic adaptor subunit [Thermoanaerobaculia bacterium]
MKRRFVPVAILVAVAVIITTIILVRQPDRDAGDLRVSGNIEVDEVEVSFRIPGRMIERSVSEGATVTAGQPIARLDDADLRHDLELRRAEAEAAAAKLHELRTGFRPEEKAQAAAAVDQAEADAQRTASELRRSNELFAKDVISERELEAAKAAHGNAAARLDQARQKLALLRNGFRVEEVAQARANVARAAEAVAAAETRLGWAVAVAPVGGTVLSDIVEPGEQVSPGTPVVTIGNLRDVWMRGYIAAGDLGRVKLGTSANITTDAYPGKVYQGQVSFISPEAEFTPKSVQTEKERVKLVYRIKIRVTNPSQELKAGMPADAVLAGTAR